MSYEGALSTVPPTEERLLRIQHYQTRRSRAFKTKDKTEAQRLLVAMNEACKLPAMNLGLARVYLRHSDPLVATRTWQHAMEEIVKTKQGPTQDRWATAIKDNAFDTIRSLP